MRRNKPPKTRNNFKKVPALSPVQIHMEAITASLERSLQNCSLNNHQSSSSNNNMMRKKRHQEKEEEEDDHVPAENNITTHHEETTLELNSHISLPYHWEQCLDLKTGEIYYINWSNGMKAKEDPRSRGESGGDEHEYEESEDSWYDSEESSTEFSLSNNKEEHYAADQRQLNDNNNNNNNNVLVVAGCKSCLMYVMVPKQLQQCPKCTGQLLHFDPSQNASP